MPLFKAKCQFHHVNMVVFSPASHVIVFEGVHPRNSTSPVKKMDDWKTILSFLGLPNLWAANRWISGGVQKPNFFEAINPQPIRRLVKTHQGKTSQLGEAGIVDSSMKLVAILGLLSRKVWEIKEKTHIFLYPPGNWHIPTTGKGKESSKVPLDGIC